MDHASIVNAVMSVKTYKDCQFVFTVLLANGVPIETMKEAFDEAVRREKVARVSAESARYAAERRFSRRNTLKRCVRR